MQDLLHALMHGPFNAILMLGSGGCGKTFTGKEMFRLAKILLGVAAVARCVHSGRLAATIGCETYARCMSYGSYAPHEHPPYSDISAAKRIADLNMLFAEEVTAMPNRSTEHHLGAYKAAKQSVNWAASRLLRPEPYDDLEQPLAGMKLVASGDHLQQIVAPGGIGRIVDDPNSGDHGTAVPYMSADAPADNVWQLQSLQREDANVLVLFVHDNHRLLGRMHEMHRTGCAGTCQLMMPL